MTEYIKFDCEDCEINFLVEITEKIEKVHCYFCPICDNSCFATDGVIVKIGY